MGKLTEISTLRHFLNIHAQYTTIIYRSHRSETYTNDGKTYTLAAEVGILTRNIKIVGAPFEDQVTDI